MYHIKQCQFFKRNLRVINKQSNKRKFKYHLNNNKFYNLNRKLLNYKHKINKSKHKLLV